MRRKELLLVRALILILAIVSSVPVAAQSLAQASHIQVTLSTEEADDVSFDPTRVSGADVRRWILLSEYGPYSEATSSFSPCPEFQEDQRANTIDKQSAAAQKVIAELDKANFPPELAPVVDYLREFRSGWYWIDTQELEFVRSRNISKLEEPYDGIDSAKLCAGSLEKVRTSPDNAKAAYAACYDWGNCINDALHKKLGPYPREAWQKFLDAYGIRETIHQTIE